MDSPVTGEAKEVGIYDLHTGEARRVELPATCWHLATHPTEDLFYPVSFRVAPQEGRDWKDWAIGFSKEYAFEVDAESARFSGTGRSAGRPRLTSIRTSPSRTASSSSATGRARASSSSTWRPSPSGGSSTRSPDLRAQAKVARQVGTQAYDALARGSLFTSNQHFLVRCAPVGSPCSTPSTRPCSARTSRCSSRPTGASTTSPIYDYPSNTYAAAGQDARPSRVRARCSRAGAIPRLGFHHSYLVSP